MNWYFQTGSQPDPWASLRLSEPGQAPAPSLPAGYWGRNQVHAVSLWATIVMCLPACNNPATAAISHDLYHFGYFYITTLKWHKSVALIRHKNLSFSNRILVTFIHGLKSDMYPNLWPCDTNENVEIVIHVACCLYTCAECSHHQPAWCSVHLCYLYAIYSRYAS